MNRYVAAGLIADAQAGKDVLYIGRSEMDARTALHECLHLLKDDSRVQKVTHSNGGAGISFTDGGTIKFKSAYHNLRGYSINVVFLDEIHDYRTLEQITPVVMSRPNGEIIRS